MSPIINFGKICLSHIWKIQKFLEKSLEQAKYDFKDKNNYKPLANRKDQTKATDWSTLRKQWPSVNWDNEIMEMDLSSLPVEDQGTVKNMLHEVEKYYEIFQSNMKSLKGRKVKRNAFSHSILIVFSDASGGKNYSSYGCVEYVRNTYEDNSIGWMLVAAMSKIANEDMTIVIKELKGVKLATILAH